MREKDSEEEQLPVLVNGKNPHDNLSPSSQKNGDDGERIDQPII